MSRNSFYVFRRLTLWMQCELTFFFFFQVFTSIKGFYFLEQFQIYRKIERIVQLVLEQLVPRFPFSYLTLVLVLVSQSCPTLCDPMDCSPPGSSVHEIFQARILEWFAISFSKKQMYHEVNELFDLIFLITIQILCEKFN